MTNDELLAKIDEYFAYGRINDTLAKALRAVVELHKPTNSIFKMQFVDDNIEFVCKYCGYEYPCKTIQAIEKELK